MIETYTTKKPTHGVVKKLTHENYQLNLDDELFYDTLKDKMDTLLRQPQPTSINKITSYSKTLEIPSV